MTSLKVSADKAILRVMNLSDILDCYELNKRRMAQIVTPDQGGRNNSDTNGLIEKDLN